MKRAQTYDLTDPNQLEAVAHPRRQDMVDRLAASGPLSIRELAEQVGARPTALYHHLQKLIGVGLVVEAGARVRRRRRELLYQTIAPRMRLAKAHRDPRHGKVIADIALAQTREMARDFRRGQFSEARVDDGEGRNFTFFRLLGRPSPSQLKRINKCLSQLTELLWEANDPNSALVGLGCVMAPLEEPSSSSERVVQRTPRAGAISKRRSAKEK